MSLSNPVCARASVGTDMGCGDYGDLCIIDVPVIHIGMIVGRWGASIRIRPLQNEHENEGIKKRGLVGWLLCVTEINTIKLRTCPT